MFQSFIMIQSVINNNSNSNNNKYFIFFFIFIFIGILIYFTHQSIFSMNAIIYIEKLCLLTLTIVGITTINIEVVVIYSDLSNRRSISITSFQIFFLYHLRHLYVKYFNYVQYLSLFLTTIIKFSIIIIDNHLKSIKSKNYYNVLFLLKSASTSF